MLTPIKLKLGKELSGYFNGSATDVMAMFEIPRSIEHGHLAIPVFSLAKELKKAPPIIAKEIAQNLLTKKIDGVDSADAVGGYLNFKLDEQFLLSSMYAEVRANPHSLGHSNTGAGKKIVIDYVSPNVAKPLHVGHLRATVIGQAIRNLAQTQGYEVMGLNHLGDWGVQFGKLAYGYKLWGSEYNFKDEPFESLFKLYIRFHEEAEENPSLDVEGSLAFKRLEEGDPELGQLWQWFVEVSLKDFEKQMARLGVRHELVRGESFYNDRLASVERLLEQKNLLVESDGAMVVMLEEEKMPPCLIRKSDGASLYATRDIASAIYRHDELKADINLYVVGSEQTLHFKQVFSVLTKMGFEWAANCHHIGFGMYRFKDMGKMSSRKGQIIRLSDLLDRAIELVKEMIAKKNPELPNKDRVAEEVAMGAIIFNDLMNDRLRDVEFDWEKALTFDGDSGPYLQYVHVRCRSILQKLGTGLPEKVIALESKEERELMKCLMQFEFVLGQAFHAYKPNILANYLLDLASSFNRFYHNHRIIGGEEKFLDSRVVLVYVTQMVLKKGLELLGIRAPEAM